MRDVETLVIGGGQAGLATAFHLARRGVDHLVVDAAATPGAVWRSRWESLRLFTPARHDGLPGMAFPAPGDTHPTKDQVADYLAAYIDRFELPVRFAAPVRRLTGNGGGFVADLDDSSVRARSVIVATGPFQVPLVPGIAAGLGRAVVQVHSSAYRNPASLPVGTTLVVGGGNSGFQIAEELAESRPVTLAVGRRLPSLPQRFAGRDLFDWLGLLGVTRVPARSWLGRRLQRRDLLVGTGPRSARRAGVRLVGRIAEIDGGRVRTAEGEWFSLETVIWCTGYRRDHSWIDVPGALDAGGAPRHVSGVSPVAGLGFVGLPWQRTRRSALLGGVGEDAAHVVSALGAGHVSLPSASDVTVPVNPMEGV